MRVLASIFSALGLLILPGLRPAEPTPRREFRPAVGNGRLSAFNATGALVAVGGGAAPVALFETRTGLLLRTYTGHAQAVTALAFAPHPDTVLSADASGQVRLWRAETLAPLRQWQAPGPLLAVAFVPGGTGHRRCLLAVGPARPRRSGPAQAAAARQEPPHGPGFRLRGPAAGSGLRYGYGPGA